MNKYEERQAARKARYERLADKAAQASDQAYETGHKLGSALPLGQPILVGHHSEKRHRKLIDRLGNLATKSNDLSKKAEYYANKAASVGTGGISSDDPEAVNKLKEKLAYLEFLQNRMKEANRLIRKNDIEGLKKLIPDFEKLLTPDCMGDIGYPRYALTNNGAEIRRIKKRIAVLEKCEVRKTTETEYKNLTYREDVAENRIMFIFKTIPDKEIRDYLKSWGFKWSPTRGAWIRQFTVVGLAAAKIILQKLVDEL